MRHSWKLKARINLSGKYGDALGVAVLTSIMVGALSILFSIASSLGLPASQSFLFDIFGLSDLTGQAFDPEILLEGIREILVFFVNQTWLLVLLLLLTFLIRPLYALLVGNVVRVGQDRWFLRAAHTDVAPPIGMMFSLFRRGEYGRTVGAMFYRAFWLFVWSLPPYLALILGTLPQQILIYFSLANRMPLTQGFILRIAKQTGLPLLFFSPLFFLLGLLFSFIFSIILIRKRYRYRMMTYVLADNPALGARRALQLSKEMTRGQVGRLFVLDLSFLGWVLLSLMCLCLPWIGLHLLAPYYRMTWAEAYKSLRDQAAAQGIVRMEELGYLRLA